MCTDCGCSVTPDIVKINHKIEYQHQLKTLNIHQDILSKK